MISNFIRGAIFAYEENINININVNINKTV